MPEMRDNQINTFSIATAPFRRKIKENFLGAGYKKIKNNKFYLCNRFCNPSLDVKILCDLFILIADLLYITRAILLKPPVERNYFKYRIYAIRHFIFVYSGPILLQRDLAYHLIYDKKYIRHIQIYI